MFNLIGKGRIHQATRKTHRWQIAILGKLGLLLGKFLSLLQKLEFVEIGVQSVGIHRFYLPRIHITYLDLLFCRIIYHILEHGILLIEHGNGVITLYGEILDVEFHTLHIYLQTHLIIVESLGDAIEFLQTLDVVVHQTNLLSRILCHVIHLGSLYDEIFTCLLVRELVEMVCNLGNVDGSIHHLVVEWHLELQACRSIILQGFGYIVRFAVGRTIRHGNGRGEVVVQLCHGIDLRQQFSLVLADGILSLCNLVPAFLQRQIILHRHLQALAQRQSFLRHHCRKSPESQTKTQYLFLVHF